MTTKTGFIGLGNMGYPMTAMLAKAGQHMLVYDPSAPARQRAAAIDGVELACGHAEVAAACGVVFTCVPNDAILRELYLAGGGVVDNMMPGSITVDCSTVHPDSTREIADAMSLRGAFHLDASMLGSVPQAETGEIGFVVGGDPGAFEQARPLLDITGRFVKYAGPSGSANQIKLIHQTIVAANAVVVAEALGLCMATGTDIDVFMDVVLNGGGFAYSRYIEKRTPRIREGDYSPLFDLNLMSKDAGLGADLARGVSLDTPLLERVLEIYADAREVGLGEDDFSAIARLYERAVGCELKDYKPQWPDQ